MTPHKQRPPRFAPFKIGDRVVMCPHKTALAQRGQTGTIRKVEGHLVVQVDLDSRISLTPTEHIKEIINTNTYCLRHASECHDCIHRVTHMVGGFCPPSYREIVFYETKEEEEVDKATQSPPGNS